jgi:hypothetical protein
MLPKGTELLPHQQQELHKEVCILPRNTYPSMPPSSTLIMQQALNDGFNKTAAVKTGSEFSIDFFFETCYTNQQHQKTSEDVSHSATTMTTLTGDSRLSENPVALTSGMVLAPSTATVENISHNNYTNTLCDSSTRGSNACASITTDESDDSTVNDIFTKLFPEEAASIKVGCGIDSSNDNGNGNSNDTGNENDNYVGNVQSLISWQELQQEHKLEYWENQDAADGAVDDSSVVSIDSNSCAVLDCFLEDVEF